jgi:DNA-directed RNA polymerase subunit RPC12/RpoP
MEDGAISWECAWCGTEHEQANTENYSVFDTPSLICSRCGKMTDVELDGDTDHGFFNTGARAVEEPGCEPVTIPLVPLPLVPLDDKEE